MGANARAANSSTSYLQQPSVSRARMPVQGEDSGKPGRGRRDQPRHSRTDMMQTRAIGPWIRFRTRAQDRAIGPCAPFVIFFSFPTSGLLFTRCLLRRTFLSNTVSNL